MSLINDALKEAKAQSGHASLPPDLAEKIQQGGGMPSEQNKDNNNDNNNNDNKNGETDSTTQKTAPKKKRPSGARSLTGFALIFLLLIGGLIAAGYFLFPDLARQAGLADSADEQTQSDPVQAAEDTTETDDAAAESATQTTSERESSSQSGTEDTALAEPEPASEPEPEPEPGTGTESVPESAPKATDGTVDEAPETPRENDAEAAPEPDSAEPQSVETAAEEPESVQEAAQESSKPQPAPPSMRRDFHLSAIVGTASRRMAVINGGIVQAGDTVNDITIVSISRRRLVVEKDGSQYILRPSSAEK